MHPTTVKEVQHEVDDEITGLVFGALVLAHAAYAETPREQLKQMVEQLQQSPNDNALREKIIKLAPTLKPSPALPDTAVAFEGRAQFAFKSAKSEGDFLAAAQEYEKAVAVAPWVLGYYSDLCTIYEKAGKFEDAKRHCGFYLIGLTDPAQMTDVKRRIAGLEFGIEKTNSPQARAERERDEFAVFLRQNEGAIFIANRTAGGYAQAIIENGVVVMGVRHLDEDTLRLNPDFRGKLVHPRRFPVKQFTDSAPDEVEAGKPFLVTLTFSRDGNTLTQSFTQFPGATPVVNIYKRAN